MTQIPDQQFERFFELKQKLTRKGLSPEEQREFEALSKSAKAESDRFTAEKAELRKQARIVEILQRVRFKNQVLRDCVANEQAILELPPQMTPEEISSAFAANPKLAAGFLWMDPPAAKTDKKAEQHDREEFSAFAKQNRYSECVANFNAARELLGYGKVTAYGLTQAVQSNALRLSPASSQELEEREAERIDSENLRLRMADTQTLRQETRDGYTLRRAKAQAEEKQRAFEAKQEAEEGMKYPPLPEFLPEFLARKFGNRRLDRDFLVKHGNRDIFRFLHERWGQVAIEERLRGIR